MPAAVRAEVGTPIVDGESHDIYRQRRTNDECSSVASRREFDHAAPVLRCEECKCYSETGRGWFGFIAEDPDDDEGPVVATYCPPCAQRELDAQPRQRAYL